MCYQKQETSSPITSIPSSAEQESLFSLEQCKPNTIDLDCIAHPTEACYGIKRPHTTHLSTIYQKNKKEVIEILFCLK